MKDGPATGLQRPRLDAGSLSLQRRALRCTHRVSLHGGSVCPDFSCGWTCRAPNCAFGLWPSSAESRAGCLHQWGGWEICWAWRAFGWINKKGIAPAGTQRARQDGGGSVLIRDFFNDLQNRLDQIDRHREDDRGIFLGTNFRQRLQIAQLHAAGCRSQNGRRIHQRLCGLEFSVSMNHLGAAVAFSLRLLGDGAHHVFGQFDISDLHHADLDAPGLGLGVQNGLNIGIDLAALGQHFIQVVLAQHRAQGGLRQLAGCGEKIFHLDKGLFWIDDAEIQHRIHLDGHVVPRDHVLRWHLVHHGAQIHSGHALQHGDHENQPGPFDPLEATELEHHGPLVFVDDLEGRGQKQHQNDQEEEQWRQDGNVGHGGAGNLKSGCQVAQKPSSRTLARPEIS